MGKINGGDLLPMAKRPEICLGDKKERWKEEANGEMEKWRTGISIQHIILEEEEEAIYF
jgi:hypothetical protein